MKIRKVLRRAGGPGRLAVNAVVAANLGEPGEATVARSRQDVRIVQRNGRTEVFEPASDATPERSPDKDA